MRESIDLISIFDTDKPIRNKQVRSQICQALSVTVRFWDSPETGRASCRLFADERMRLYDHMRGQERGHSQTSNFSNVRDNPLRGDTCRECFCEKFREVLAYEFGIFHGIVGQFSDPGGPLGLAHFFDHPA
jgi:hypothetical protein